MAGVALSEEQLRAFSRDGYIVVPDVVDRERVAGALQAANHRIGVRYESCEPDPWKAFTTDPLFGDLLTGTSVRDYAQHLVGGGVEAMGMPQVAVRFPVEPGAAAKKAGAHLDGITADLTAGELHSFTLLAGVLLSDVAEPDQGNTVVWPGTHHRVADWFRHNGTAVADPAAAGRAMGTIAWQAANPTPVCGNAGDLLLAHYLLLHGAGPHTGPHIRYAVFYRLRALNHLAHQQAACSDPFHEYPALRRFQRP